MTWHLHPDLRPCPNCGQPTQRDGFCNRCLGDLRQEWHVEQVTPRAFQVVRYVRNGGGKRVVAVNQAMGRPYVWRCQSPHLVEACRDHAQTVADSLNS